MEAAVSNPQDIDRTAGMVLAVGMIEADTGAPAPAAGSRVYPHSTYHAFPEN